VTFALVRAQGEPKVVVYVCHDSDRPSVILIRIANIGRDVATDITFKASRPIPARAFGMSPDGPTPTETMTGGPLINGIPLLGPGDTRDTTWGQFHGLTKALGETPIDISFRYKHGRRTLTGSSRLEVASFSETDASTNPYVQSSRSLESIAKSLNALAQAARRRQKPQTPEEQQQILMMMAAGSGIAVTVAPKSPPDKPPEDQS
jgi:hypothetical protein